MNQEKFVSSYIELLCGTLTEAIQKNVVLQAQKKVLEEEIQLFKNREEEISSMKFEHDKQINELKSQLNDARKLKESAVAENIDLRKMTSHVETFKNELTKAREEIQSLNKIVSEKDSLISELNLLNKKEEENTKAAKDTVNNKGQKPKNKVKNLFLEEEQLVLPLVKDAGNF